MRATSTGASMPSEPTFTRDWFDTRIKKWSVWLEPCRGKRGLRFLEIGSFEGRSTRWLMENILTSPDSTIDCADLFCPVNGFEDYYSTFLANLAPFAERVNVLRGPSSETLKHLDKQYDFVYVDGSHTAFDTQSDAIMSWRHLKVGGIMIFDDYMWYPTPAGKRPRRPNAIVRAATRLTGMGWRERVALREIARYAADCPKPGIDGFLATVPGQYEIIGRGYQLALRKTDDLSSGLESSIGLEAPLAS
jgi:predicted O-methyltransferase YrrM